ncbi:MAG TPA: hypothetical protein VH142_11010 [Polyangiaceae bacterium]|jgi:hypothetical protein|nr:hypothetical protein [Polyangiaceae bacterium]
MVTIVGIAALLGPGVAIFGSEALYRARTMKTVRILLQTTIAETVDDWHIGRFSLLQRHLASIHDDGVRFDVVGRNVERGADGADRVLSKLAESDFDELWIFAVDVGDGLTRADCAGIDAFRRRGGGVLTARDHQDLGCSLLTLDGVGPGNFFHTKNPDPVLHNRCIDDTETTAISWPNFHSGSNGDTQRVTPVLPVHELLSNPARRGGVVERFPAHPHEGAVGVPAESSVARVIATGTSKRTGRAFNLAVAFDRERDGEGRLLGRAVAESSFHHFADYNWDTRTGAPSFVTEPPSLATANDPSLLDDIKAYVANVARWLRPAGAR